MASVLNQCKELLKKPLYLLPQDTIFFESVPDLSDNTKAVFDEMLRRGLNKTYRMVWLVSEQNGSYPTIENVFYVHDKSPRLRTELARAKAVIACNHFWWSQRKGSVSFYLDHGNPIKKIAGYPAEVNFHICSSEAMRQMRHDVFGVPLDHMVVAGYARNDELTLPPVDLHGCFEAPYQKLIVWYPTFRQHNRNARSSADSTHALPVIWDEEQAVAVNRCAAENGVLLVLKPHFAQDVSKIKNLRLSHIQFIGDDFFVKHQLTSYRFVASCDALLTDYSSIYFDYTLCDKPIGLVWEDYEEYRQKPGFVLDMDEMMKGGVKIYNADDLNAFIRDVAAGEDRLQAQRREIRDLSNVAVDGNNAKRTVDRIMERIAEGRTEA